jgi:hypothetical protein
MKNKIWIAFAYFFLGECFAQEGPYHFFVRLEAPPARNRAIGNIGYALSDDELRSIFNPAGLGFFNERINGGAFSNISLFTDSSVFENQFAFAYQRESNKNIGFAGNFNFRNVKAKRIYGERFFDDYTNKNVIVEYWDGIYRLLYDMKIGLSAGYRFYSNSFSDHVIGISGSYCEIERDPNIGPTIKGTWGDFGYIFQGYKKIRIGLTLKNIAFQHSDLSDVLPVSLCVGLGYRNSSDGEGARSLGLASEFSFIRRLGTGPDSNSINTGIEALLYNTFYARVGYVAFPKIADYDISFGEGLSLFNHIDFNFYHYLEKTKDGRSYSFGFASSLKRILKWNKSDLTWWRR